MRIIENDTIMEYINDDSGLFPILKSIEGKPPG